MWNYRETRNRTALRRGQATWDNRSDPLWDGPDPEPDDEPAAEELDSPDLEGPQMAIDETWAREKAREMLDRDIECVTTGRYQLSDYSEGLRQAFLAIGLINDAEERDFKARAKAAEGQRRTEARRRQNEQIIGRTAP